MLMIISTAVRGSSRSDKAATYPVILQGIEAKDSIEHTNAAWPGPMMTT